MKVVHLTPTYFDDESVIGGGERYPTELAAWMAREVETTLVSFGARRRSYRKGGLRVEVYPVRHFIHGNRVNPFSLRYLAALREATVVHVHHIHTIVSDLACLVASLLKKPAFVTDYGGGGSLVLNRRLRLLKRYRGAIAYSRYGADFLPLELKRCSSLIKGGIDTERFSPDNSLRRERKILYVGRILPHKGINYLIDAFRALERTDYVLRIVGRIYDERFYDHLRAQARGYAVEFVHDADDERLLHEYRTAKVTVLPSVHKTMYEDYTAVPELMGFTLLESQACGTPVVCTDAGAMSEFIAEGRTGHVVAQNSGAAIAAALRLIIDATPAAYAAYETRCREFVAPLCWPAVVREHLRTYAAMPERHASACAA
ncbi:MAG: glycosyltransferase family 4 protein [Pyrinomonadaceae bacterium]